MSYISSIANIIIIAAAAATSSIIVVVVVRFGNLAQPQHTIAIEKKFSTFPRLFFYLSIRCFN